MRTCAKLELVKLRLSGLHVVILQGIHQNLMYIKKPSDLKLFNLNLLNLVPFDFVRFAFLKEKGNRKESYTNQLYYVILNYRCIIILSNARQSCYNVENGKT